MLLQKEVFSLIPKRACRIACIGGSAGATDIYLEILRNLRSDIGLAFVMVPHRVGISLR